MSGLEAQMAPSLQFQISTSWKTLEQPMRQTPDHASDSLACNPTEGPCVSPNLGLWRCHWSMVSTPHQVSPTQRKQDKTREALTCLSWEGSQPYNAHYLENLKAPVLGFITRHMWGQDLILVSLGIKDSFSASLCSLKTGGMICSDCLNVAKSHCPKRWK